MARWNPFGFPDNFGEQYGPLRQIYVITGSSTRGKTSSNELYNYEPRPRYRRLKKILCFTSFASSSNEEGSSNEGGKDKHHRDKCRSRSSPHSTPAPPYSDEPYLDESPIKDAMQPSSSHDQPPQLARHWAYKTPSLSTVPELPETSDKPSAFEDSTTSLVENETQFSLVVRHPQDVSVGATLEDSWNNNAREGNYNEFLVSGAKGKNYSRIV